MGIFGYIFGHSKPKVAVADAIGQKVAAGNYVVLQGTSGNRGFITVGKMYKVTAVNLADGEITIVDDSGGERFYRSSRFLLVSLA